MIVLRRLSHWRLRNGYLGHRRLRGWRLGRHLDLRFFGGERDGRRFRRRRVGLRLLRGEQHGVDHVYDAVARDYIGLDNVRRIHPNSTVVRDSNIDVGSVHCRERAGRKLCTDGVGANDVVGQDRLECVEILREEERLDGPLREGGEGVVRGGWANRQRG